MTAEEEVVVTEDQLADLLAFGAEFTLIEDAVQNLELITLGDDEVAAFLLMPATFRMKMTARLVELAEVMREALRELDGRVLQLTNGQAG